jgi:hypothetical protein
MKIEVSNGELLDKLSILEIKLERVGDLHKLTNIRHEYDAIRPLADVLIPQAMRLYDNLRDVNRDLWDIEDRIRVFEADQDFGPDFISSARKVYRLNDERSRLKKEINLRTGSGLIEEKSYAGS